MKLIRTVFTYLVLQALRHTKYAAAHMPYKKKEANSDNKNACKIIF